MTKPTRKIPALALCLLMAALALPAWGGGRDVPDQKKSGSSSDSSTSSATTGGVSTCSGETVTTATIAGVTYEVRISSDGEVSYTPALLGKVGRWLDRLLGGGDSGSCVIP